jgi:hypothetical protein
METMWPTGRRQRLHLVSKNNKKRDCSKATGKLLGSNLLGFVPKQPLAGKNESQAGYILKTLSHEKLTYT